MKFNMSLDSTNQLNVELVETVLDDINIEESNKSFDTELDHLKPINVELSDKNVLEMTLDNPSGGSGTNNYEELTNKPKINNVTLIGNKTGKDLGLLDKEIDPTVPKWAKESKKPDYTACEVGAVDINNEASFEQIDSWFKAVFNI